MIDHIPPNELSSSVGDAVSLGAWLLLAVWAIAFAMRLQAGLRSAWIIVALSCTTIAVDKIVDLQMIVYRTARGFVHMLSEPVRKPAIIILLLLLMGVAVSGTIWMARRDGKMGKAAKLAIGGLVLILLLVGFRVMPGIPQASEPIKWSIESVACLMVASGLAIGCRGARMRRDLK